MISLSQQLKLRDLLQSWHSSGRPEQDPPKDWGKQEPDFCPARSGPTYIFDLAAFIALALTLEESTPAQQFSLC